MLLIPVRKGIQKERERFCWPYLGNAEVRKLGDILGPFSNSDVTRPRRAYSRSKQEVWVDCKREGVCNGYSNKGVDMFLWCCASMAPQYAPLVLGTEMVEHQAQQYINGVVIYREHNMSGPCSKRLTV